MTVTILNLEMLFIGFLSFKLISDDNVTGVLLHWL